MAILYFVWIAYFRSATLKNNGKRSWCYQITDVSNFTYFCKRHRWTCLSKQNIFKRSIFILHNNIFLNFINAVMCCILDIQLIHYQLKENSLCIADMSPAIFFPRSVSTLKFWIKSHQTFRIATVKVILCSLNSYCMNKELTW